MPDFVKIFEIFLKIFIFESIKNVKIANFWLKIVFDELW